LQKRQPGRGRRSKWVLSGRTTTTTSRRFATEEEEEPYREQHQGSSSSSNKKTKDGIDLFEYFDPLLSPHAYPDGVSPNHKPTTPRSSPSSWYPQTLQSSQPESSSPARKERKFNNPFGFEIPTVPKAQREAATTATTTTTTTVAARPTTADANAATSSEPKQGTPDLFEYFDPLLSPHAYPNGISATWTTTKPSSTTTTTTTQPDVPTVVQNKNKDDDDRYNPLRFKTLPIDSASSSSSSNVNSGGMVIGSTTTTTPTTGTKDNTKKKSKKKLGILLMDHGSRNAKSNQRLEQLAQLYELSFSMDNNDDNEDSSSSSSNSSSSTVVQAAHMEIAEPSIEQGLQALLNQGVGT
jgi:hypothetical protein